MMVLHHVLNDVALAFEVFDFGHLGKFGLELELFAQRGVDDLAVGAVVELGADVVFY
jgi:hypothetical protein